MARAPGWRQCDGRRDSAMKIEVKKAEKVQAPIYQPPPFL